MKTFYPTSDTTETAQLKLKPIHKILSYFIKLVTIITKIVQLRLGRKE